ncbi:MAG: DUF4321 domain-containing protein [Elusimicrobia bacterium]|nr:DUF4321 domain-containing protein [Elusimicrobiota bacterium]
MKNAIHVIIIVVVGSLIGMFINKLFNVWFAAGKIAELMSTGINTGLKPTTIDLSLFEFTIGLIFKFNIASLIGIFISAVIYKQLVK